MSAISEKLDKAIRRDVWQKLTEEKMKTVKWRPIDSAPKDGRTVLLLIPHPELKDKRITGRWDGQEWVAEPMLFDFGCVDVPDPIGWMPLEWLRPVWDAGGDT